MSLEFVHIKVIFLFGIMFSFIGVGLGAMGTHLLKNSIPADLLALFETGVRYQMFHSLGTLLSAFFFLRWKRNLFQISASLFLCGILLFSGSLYTIALTGNKIFGRITPLGGILFLLGWLAMFYSFIKLEKNEF